MFLTFLLVDVLYQLIVGFVIDKFFPETFDHIQVLTVPYDLFVRFFLLVLIAPFLETLIFQFLIIEGLSKLKAKPLIVVSVSAALFSLAHGYNVVYIVAVFPAGLLFGYYYYILRTEDKAIAFLSVVALHAAFNLLAYMNNYFLVQ